MGRCQARKQPVSYKGDTAEYMSEFYAKSVIDVLVKKKKKKKRLEISKWKQE